MGCRSVQRYLCRRKSRLHASVLPEDKQTRCTEEHPLCTRRCSNRTEPSVRSHAFRTEFLPDSVTVDRSLYLIMYMLMFSGAIVLRYKMKKLNRPFRIGKNGNGLMWLIGGLGFCGSLLAFVLSFIPPTRFQQAATQYGSPCSSSVR